MLRSHLLVSRVCHSKLGRLKLGKIPTAPLSGSDTTVGNSAALGTITSAAASNTTNTISNTYTNSFASRVHDNEHVSSHTKESRRHLPITRKLKYKIKPTIASSKHIAAHRLQHAPRPKTETLPSPTDMAAMSQENEDVASRTYPNTGAAVRKEQVMSDISWKDTLPGLPISKTQRAPQQQQHDDAEISTDKLRGAERYEIDGLVGGGRFGVVRGGIDRRDGSRVAIKVLRKERHLAIIKGEAAVHRWLHKRLGGQHSSLTVARDLYEDSKNVYIVMERIDGGDLFDYIISNGTFDNVQAALLLRRIVDIVKLLQKHHVTHRDLKPENVLFRTVPQTDENPSRIDVAHPVLSDFGLAKIDGHEDPIPAPAGTFGYAAPEILLKKQDCDTSCDVWSLGVLIYAAIAGVLPFPAGMDGSTTVQTHLEEVMAGPRFEEPQWKNISSSGIVLIQQMLHYKSFSRPSLDVIANHPWVLGQECPTSGSLGGVPLPSSLNWRDGGP